MDEQTKRERPRAHVLMNQERPVRIEVATAEAVAGMNELAASRGLPYRYRRATVLDLIVLHGREAVLALAARAEAVRR